MQGDLLTIVIATWNTKELTLRCLDSIHNIKDYGSLKDKLEIIVVDNASNDGTAAAIRERYDDVEVTVNAENFGYAIACNQGMTKADGKFILLLGSDTELTDGSLLGCIEFLDNNSPCGAVGCKLIYPDGKLQGNCKKFPTLLNGVFTYLSLDSLNKGYDMAGFDYNRTIKVDQIATTFLMIRRSVLEEIKYFDEQYRILYNDVDLCKRIYGTGYEIWYLHTVTVIHEGSYSTNKAPSKVRKVMYEDVYRYYKNNFGFFAVVLIPILFVRFILVSIFK
jgi:GT2 family glycosyltransferase